MNLFFYDIDDIDEIKENMYNIIINSLLYPVGHDNLYFSINKYYRKYYYIIFKNNKYSFKDLFNNNYDKIKKLIDDYNNTLENDINMKKNIINKHIDTKNNCNSLYNNLLYDESQLYDDKINILVNCYIKIQLIKNLSTVKNITINKLEKYKLDYNDYNNLKKQINNNTDYIKEVIDKDITNYMIKEKLTKRKELILSNDPFILNITKIIDDMYCIVKNDITNYTIIQLDNSYLKLYIKGKLNDDDVKYYKIELNNISEYQKQTKEIDKNDIKELYENKDYKFLNEMSDKEAMEFIIDKYKLCYNKEYKIKYKNIKNIDKVINVYTNVFNNLIETLYSKKLIDINLNKYNLSKTTDNIIVNNDKKIFDILSLGEYIKDIKNIQTILKYILLVETDYNLKTDENCQDILKNNKFYLEMIHPVFVHRRYNEATNNIDLKYVNYDDIKLKGFQKQGVLGLGKYILIYRNCYKYFFNTFIQKDDKGKDNLVENYFLLLNKMLLKTFQYRNNLFTMRFITNGDLPQKFNKYTDERFIEEVSKNNNYIGILEREIKEIIHKNYGNKVYNYVYKHRDSIQLYNHEMEWINNSIRLANTTYTYMELSQLCFYLNLKAYKFKDNLIIKDKEEQLNEKMIFFSKYDIFNLDEKYDEEVYNDYLTKEEFEKTLLWYRDKLERIYCFKYPSGYLPKCLIDEIGKEENINILYNEKEKKKLENTYIVNLLNDYLFNDYTENNIFIYKKENDNKCKILNYSKNNYIR